MNETKRIQEIEEVLTPFLQGELMVAVKQYRLLFLDEVEKPLRRLEMLSSATDDYDQLLESLSEELQEIGKIIEEKQSSTLADTYLQAVKKHTMDLPQEVVIRQSQARFKSSEDDSAGIKLGKFSKRSARAALDFGYGFFNFSRKYLNRSTKAQARWEQKIPLQRLTEFHLYKVDELLKTWADTDYGLLTSVITEIEQFFAGKPEEGEFFNGRQSRTALFEILNGLHKQLADIRDGIEKQLADDFEMIQQKLFYYVERTGTLERRAGFYSPAKVERRFSQLRSGILQHINTWTEVNRQLLGRAKAVEEFLEYKKELESRSTKFLKFLEAFFAGSMIKPFQSLQQDLGSLRTKLQELKKRKQMDAAAKLLVDGNELLKKYIRDIQNTLNRKIEGTELSLKANQFVEDALLKANDFPEQALFVYDVDLEQTPPTQEHKIIEWRLMIVRGLKEQIFNRLQPSQQRYEEFLVKMNGSLTEITEVIEVNLKSAIDLFESREKDGNPFDIAVEALERTHTKLENNISEVREKQEALKQVILQGGEDFCSNIIHLIHNGDSREMQLLDAKYKLKETTQGWQTKAGARWARIEDSVALLWRFGWRKIKKYVSAIRRFLGFEQKEAEQIQKTDISTYLSETDAKINELPYIYRRLFNFGMEADRRFYIALNEHFSYLEKAFNSWENGFPATFGVIGEKGSGKSTYLNFALEDYFAGRECKRITFSGGYYNDADFFRFIKSEFGIDNVQTLDDVVSVLRDSGTKQVIVLEALQNFYLRTINGYGALESLLYVISETKDVVFWIVSCSVYAWNFLDKTASIGEYFSHVIRTDALDESQIESVIINRHRSSGYELVFEPSAAHSKNRAYRKLMDKEASAQKYLREAFFEDLTGLSEGNASIAMIFWIRSIRKFDDTHFYIKPVEVTSVEMIQEMKPEVLFTLAAIVLHDAVTPKELSRILHFTEQESRLLLIRLKTRGLLQKEGERYFVNQLMYRQIVRILKERNIIHLV